MTYILCDSRTDTGSVKNYDLERPTSVALTRRINFCQAQRWQGHFLAECWSQTCSETCCSQDGREITAYTKARTHATCKTQAASQAAAGLHVATYLKMVTWATAANS